MPNPLPASTTDNVVAFPCRLSRRSAAQADAPAPGENNIVRFPKPSLRSSEGRESPAQSVHPWLSAHEAIAHHVDAEPDYMFDDDTAIDWNPLSVLPPPPAQSVHLCFRPDGKPVGPGDRVSIINGGDPVHGMVTQLSCIRRAQQGYRVLVADGVVHVCLASEIVYRERPSDRPSPREGVNQPARISSEARRT